MRRGRALLAALGCGLGLLLAGCRATGGPFVLQGAFTDPAPAPLLAGVGEVEFTPGPGYPLAGYGGGARRRCWPLYFGAGWPGRLALDLHQRCAAAAPDLLADMLEPARGVHDPLRARALVLQAGGAALALVRLDAVVGSEELYRRVLERVADLGLRPEAVIVAANHTHSGVGAYMRERAARLAGTDNFRPEVLERLAAACAGAIRQAWAARRPAAIGFASAWDRGPDGRPLVAENRRSRYLPAVAQDALDPEIGLVVVRELAPASGSSAGAPRHPGRLLAVLVNYAVHPTVLGPDNLYYSADLAGAIERQLEARLALAEGQAQPPAVLFFNGAEGDIGPRGGHGGLRDCERLGRLLAEQVVPAVRAAPVAARAALAAAAGERALGDPYLVLALGSRRAFIEAHEQLGWRLLTAPLTLPFNLVLWALGFPEARLAVHPDLSAGVWIDLAPYALTETYRFHALAIRTEGAGSAALLTVPGEAVHALGVRLKLLARLAGATHVFVLGLANGALGYVATEEVYEQGGYEAMMTLYGWDLAARVTDSLRACLAAIGFGVPAARQSRRGGPGGD
ncbi:MAG: hypothetical protein KatS3mg102_1344 [Planctomycetota bacterium]|nr:MAG: hypothetical protein KatS3mg102_1344 [Planctomycetota bacterium]